MLPRLRSPVTPGVTVGRRLMGDGESLFLLLDLLLLVVLDLGLPLGLLLVVVVFVLCVFFGVRVLGVGGGVWGRFRLRPGLEGAGPEPACFLDCAFICLGLGPGLAFGFGPGLPLGFGPGLALGLGPGLALVALLDAEALAEDLAGVVVVAVGVLGPLGRPLRLAFSRGAAAVAVLFGRPRFLGASWVLLVLVEVVVGVVEVAAARAGLPLIFLFFAGVFSSADDDAPAAAVVVVVTAATALCCLGGRPRRRGFCRRLLFLGGAFSSSSLFCRLRARLFSRTSRRFSSSSSRLLSSSRSRRPPEVWESQARNARPSRARRRCHRAVNMRSSSRSCSSWARRAPPRPPLPLLLLLLASPATTREFMAEDLKPPRRKNNTNSTFYNSGLIQRAEMSAITCSSVS